MGAGSPSAVNSAVNSADALDLVGCNFGQPVGYSAAAASLAGAVESVSIGSAEFISDWERADLIGCKRTYLHMAS